MFGINANNVTAMGRLRYEFARETKSRAFEELVAEFGAAMLGANLEMAVEPRPDHLEYLASWLKAIKEDKTVLQRTIAAASKAVSYIDTDPAAVSA